MRAADVPDRRAIVAYTPEDLMAELGLRGNLVHAHLEQHRRTVYLVVGEESLPPVAPLTEAPIVPPLALRADEDKAPQYDVWTIVDGEVVGGAGPTPIDDPFVTQTVTLAPEDLRAWADKGEPVDVVVRVNGSPAALRHVFRPMDLRPNDVLLAGEPAEGTASALTTFHEAQQVES